jgi:hypothetical protein
VPSLGALLCPDATIAEATNGAEALSAITNHPNLIITDHQMPIMGSMELMSAGRGYAILVLSSDTGITEPSSPPAQPPFCPSRFIFRRSASSCARGCPRTRKRKLWTREDLAATRSPCGRQ